MGAFPRISPYIFPGALERLFLQPLGWEGDRMLRNVRCGYGQGRYYAGNAGRVSGRIPGRSPGTDQKRHMQKKAFIFAAAIPRLWGFFPFLCKKKVLEWTQAPKRIGLFGHGKLHAFPHQIRYRIYRFFSPEKKKCVAKSKCQACENRNCAYRE